MYSIYFEIRHKAKINAIIPIIKLSSFGQKRNKYKSIISIHNYEWCSVTLSNNLNLIVELDEDNK